MVDCDSIRDFATPAHFVLAKWQLVNQCIAEIRKLNEMNETDGHQMDTNIFGHNGRANDFFFHSLANVDSASEYFLFICN